MRSAKNKCRHMVVYLVSLIRGQSCLMSLQSAY